MLENEREQMKMIQGENREIPDSAYDRKLAVKCDNGTFVGQEKNGVRFFKGIPYAEHPVVWCAAALGSYAMAAIMNAHMTVFIREQTPLEMQGRVFSAESTLKNCAIPLGLFLGGLLADYVFEPFMRSDSTLRRWLIPFFGDSAGTGIAVQFIIAGVLGILLCLAYLK